MGKCRNLFSILIAENNTAFKTIKSQACKHDRLDLGVTEAKVLCHYGMTIRVYIFTKLKKRLQNVWTIP